MFQSLGQIQPELLSSVIASPDFRARAAATRMVGDWAQGLDEPLSMLEPRVVDDHPRVRLEAIRALARFHEPRAVEIALRALELPRDRFLDHALWLTARELAPSWIPAVQAGEFDLGRNLDRLLFALEAAGSPQVVAPLLEKLRSGSVTPDRAVDLLRIVGTLGTPDDLANALAVAVGNAPTEADRSVWLHALVDGAETRNVRPTDAIPALESTLNETLGALLDETDRLDARLAAARAAGIWKVESLGPRLGSLAQDARGDESLRIAAIDALSWLGGNSVGVLDRLAASANSQAVRASAVGRWRRVDSNAAARRAVSLFALPLTVEEVSEVFAVFLNRQGAAGAGGGCRGPVRVLRCRQDRRSPGEIRSESRRGTRRGVAEGRRAWRRPRVSLSTAERKALLADIGRIGDPVRGEVVFRR